MVFYTRYTEKVLTRRWLRLFLYSSLGDNPMARVYGDTGFIPHFSVLIGVGFGRVPGGGVTGIWLVIGAIR